MFTLLLLLGVTGFFLPQIAAFVLPNRQALAFLTSRLPANFEVNSAELSWQSPVRLGGLTVSAPDGQSIATVENVSSTQSLWDLLTGHQQPMTLNLEGFKLSLTMPASFNPKTRPDLGKLVRQIQNFKLPQPRSPTIVKVKQGIIELRDREKHLLATWEPVDLTYEYSHDPLPTHTVSLSASEARDLPQSVKLDCRWSQVSAGPTREELTFALAGEDVSLQNLRPLYTAALGEGTELGNLLIRSTGIFRRDADAGWSTQAALEIKNSQEIRSPIGGIKPVALQLPAGHHLQLELETAFDLAADQLQLPLLRLRSAETSVQLRGQVAQLSGPAMVDLAGEVRIPGLSAEDLLPEVLRKSLKVEGLQLSNMTLRGPLKPSPELPGGGFECGMDAGWQSVEGYGLKLEPGRVHCVLANNVLTTTPVDVRLNGGRLLMLPRLQLGQPSPVLHFEQGLMLEKLQLTEEVCRDWLRYISPTMANATATQGQFSLTMQAGQMPLQTPEQGDLSGTIRIHQAQVKPGPLAMEFLAIVGQLQQLVLRGAGGELGNQTLMRIADEDVRFRVVQGRVYHDRFRFAIGDVTASTVGSVGFDNTLELKLSVALPDQWFEGKGPVLQALRGDVIQLSVSGTIDKPKIDGTPLADFGKRIGVRAGLNLLDRILENRGK